MESEHEPIDLNEFEGRIVATINTTPYYMLESAIYGSFRRHGLKSASFEIATGGPFPLDRLRELVGRRVRITLLD